MATNTAVCRKLTLSGIFIILIAFGCKKENASPSSGDYYIKSNVNGISLTTTYVMPNSDLISNAYFQDDLWFHIIRGTASGSSQNWDFRVTNIDLDKITYPKTITLTDNTDEPSLDVLYNNGTEGASGNFLNDYLDPTTFHLTLNKWSNDVLEGTFEGKLIWGGGYDSTLTVKSGEFRIKLMRY